MYSLLVAACRHWQPWLPMLAVVFQGGVFSEGLGDIFVPMELYLMGPDYFSQSLQPQKAQPHPHPYLGAVAPQSLLKYYHPWVSSLQALRGYMEGPFRDRP